MPEDLLGEVLDEALADASPEQRVVIDFCSGAGSLKVPVLARGLIYVPVDIKQFPWMVQDATPVES